MAGTTGYDADQVTLEEVQHDIGLNRLTLSLAMVAGGGVVLMMVALAIGVINGESAGNAVGLLFGIGLLALIVGAAAWVGVVQPHKHFDDINVPAADDHGHGHEHDEHGHEDAHGHIAELASGHGVGHDEQPGEVNVHEPDSQPRVGSHSH